MERYSIVGVAKALLMDANNNLLGDGILDTLDNSSIEISTSSEEIRGGDRNKLIDIYYHTPTGKATISDVKFNLDVVGANVGATHSGVGNNVFKTESVTLVGTTGTVSLTPVKLKTADASAIGWVCYLGQNAKVTFSGSTFDTSSLTYIPSNATVYVTYYQFDVNAEYLQIPASIIPERIRVVLTVTLSTNETSKGIAGYAQFDIGVFQLSGSQTFNMKPNGYVSTELTGMMLEDTDGTCTAIANDLGGGKYATVSLMINDKLWYTDVVSLGIDGGDFAMDKSTSKTLRVYAITSGGKSFLATNSELTFTATEGTATGLAVGANTGIVTSSTTAGTGSVSVVITDKTSIEATCAVTVNA